MTVKEAKDFDAKALVEDCKKTLKLIDEYAMKKDLARNQRFEKWQKEVKPLANGDWQYGDESLTVSYSDRTESEDKK